MIACRVFGSTSRVTMCSMVSTTAIETTKTSSCAKGHPHSAPAHHERAEGQASAEDAPSSGWPSPSRRGEHHPGDGDERNGEAKEKHVLTAEMVRQPAREPWPPTGCRTRRETAEHLHHREVVRISASGRALAGLVDTVDDLRGHGIGDDVLDDRPQHDRNGAEHIGVIGGRSLKHPPARPWMIRPVPVNPAPIST